MRGEGGAAAIVSARARAHAQANGGAFCVRKASTVSPLNSTINNSTAKVRAHMAGCALVGWASCILARLQSLLAYHC